MSLSKKVPKCKVCGREMQLTDNDERRWYCEKDDVVFLARAGGWIQGGQVLATKPPKSYAIGIALNFLLPGAGVIYGGSGLGLIYTALTIVFLFIYWPLAIMIAVASYAHTLIAVDQRNSRISKHYSESARQVPLERPAVIVCANCGLMLNIGSKYCRRCGAEIAGQVPELGESDKTKVY